MPVHLLCECGNSLIVPEGTSDTNICCARCGRFLSAETSRANEDDPMLNETAINAQNNPTLTSISSTPPEDAKTVVYSVNEATVITKRTDHATKIFAPMGQTGEEDFEIDIPNPDEVPTPPTRPIRAENLQTVIANQPEQVNPEQQSPAPSQQGSSSRLSKFDLSQRVMRAIDKPSSPLSVTDNSGDYGVHRILKTHQKGGMGRILIAYDQYLKRDVALKELHPEVAEDESIVQRFIGEAEITAQLEHPGIVPVHTLGLDKKGFPYYTMKLIKGETLQNEIKAYHRNPTKSELMNLVRRMVSICKTMAFAHNKGVIHRDLKPANIMLGEHGETLVMDWGLAKPFRIAGDETTYSPVGIQHYSNEPRPELTMVGAIVGTPAFMSPEQASPEKYEITPVSDIFSIGTILYYLLTGQTAFSGRSTQEVLNKVRVASPPMPSDIKPNVPPGLEAICMKAMAKEPEDRYQTATELVDELCRWLDDEPIRAQKETTLQRIRRWIDHHRLLAVLVPFGFVLLFIVTVLAIHFDRNRRISFHEATIQSILNDSVDLTNYESVYLEGSRDVSVVRGDRQTGGTLLVCQVKEIPPSKHGYILIGAPEDTTWNLSQDNALTFSLFEGNLENNSTDLSTFFVRIGNGSSYFEYRPEEKFWAKRKRSNWVPFTVPLAGSSEWSRTESSFPSLSQIKWIEFHFDASKPVLFHIDRVIFKK